MTAFIAHQSSVHAVARRDVETGEPVGIQELTSEEIDQVQGGVLAAGAVVGAVVGGYAAWHSGGNAGQIAAGALLGGVSGFYCGLGMFGAAAATGIMSSFAGGGGRWTSR